MKKDKYLKLLESGLKGCFTEAEKREIVGEIAEHFDMSMADGKNEDEVAERLGDPKKLGKQYCAVTRIEKAQETKKPKDIARALSAATGTGVLSFFGVVLPSIIGYILVILLLIVAVGIAVGGIATIAIVSGVALTLGTPMLVLVIFAGIFLVALGVLLFILGVWAFKPMNKGILNGLSSIKKIFERRES
jgi:uncharacterized membrane protein